jgi:hypothetical protein
MVFIVCFLTKHSRQTPDRSGGFFDSVDFLVLLNAALAKMCGSTAGSARHFN